MASEIVEAAGHRLEVERISGTGTTLVFLHEGLGSVAAWRDFPRRVASATGRPALVYSRRGYGASERRPPPWPLTFMHDEAFRVLPALLDREGLEDVVLVGHSDGASIALLYASLATSRARGVVALAPHVIVEEVCVRSIAKIRDAFDDPTTKLRERLARHHADVDGAFNGWASAWLHPDFLRWDIRASLPTVGVPVVVIQGDADEYGTLAQVDAVCAGVAGSSRRVVLAKCGHSPHRDAPEATLAAIEQLVGELHEGSA